MQNKAIKYRSISHYISCQNPEVRDKLKELRELIKKNAPDAEEIISYNMPAYKMSKILVYFAAFKNHYSIFPGKRTIIEFKGNLGKYKTSKGTIQFSYEKAIPKRLISNIIKFRLKDILEKKKGIKN